jgi:hypothetical protein
MLTIESALAYGRKLVPGFGLSNPRFHQIDDVEVVAIDLTDADGEAAGTLDVWFEPLIGGLYGEY